MQVDFYHSARGYRQFMIMQSIHLLLLLSTYQFFVSMSCIVALLNCFDARRHCNKLLALPFEMAFEMSQSLA